MARINLGKVVPQKGVDYFTDAEVAQIKAEMESDVNTRIGAAETRITTAEGNITSNTNAISALTTRVGTAEGNITTNSNNISALGGRVTTLETNMTTAQSNISTNTGDIATLNTQQTTQDTNIATNATDIDNLEEVVGIDTDTYDYDTTKTYEIGDFTVYNKKIYRCIQAVTTPGDFNANHWEEIYILNHFDTINDEQKAQDEKITQLETDKAMLEDLIPTDTVEGETIDIDDSAKYYFKEFVPEGQTEQESTEGYNLSYVNKINDVGWGDNNSDLVGILNGLSAGEYLISCKFTLKSKRENSAITDRYGVSIRNSQGSNITEQKIWETDTIGTVKEFTVLLTITNEMIGNFTRFYLYGKGGINTGWTGTSDITEMQIALGDTQRPYEPYTGGIPGPNPSYAFPINNVTGENEIKVENKNLLDLNKAIEYWKSISIQLDVSFADNKFTANILNQVLFSNPYKFSEEVKEFTISCGNIINNSSSNARLGVCVVDDKGNVTSRSVIYANTSSTKNCNAFYFDWGTPGSFSVENIQIEKGSTKTDYIPHEEQTVTFPLEEGQYMAEGDYLADNGIHHVMNEYLVTGNETIQRLVSINKTYYKVIILNKAYVDNSINLNNFCNYYKSVRNATEFWSGSGEFTISTSGDIIFVDDRFETATEFSNWIKSLETPLKVVYKLAAETIEPYTQAQQEAYNEIQKLMSYKGVTHISQENDNLPFNLKVVYRKDPSISEANTKSEIENIKARLELLES